MAGSRPGAVRADQLAVDLGLARSRAEAQALILAGAIHLDSDAGRRLTAGQRVDPTARLVRDAGPEWASRGAEKLVAALDAFEVIVTGLTCLDAGASTGGFTDVLLRRGAKRVYAVDVGRGQLLSRLAADERVVVMDRTNLRTVTSLPEVVDLATLDLSFISLRLVLETVRERPGDRWPDHCPGQAPVRGGTGRGAAGRGRPRPRCPPPRAAALCR